MKSRWHVPSQHLPPRTAKAPHGKLSVAQNGMAQKVAETHVVEQVVVDAVEETGDSVLKPAGE